MSLFSRIFDTLRERAFNSNSLLCQIVKNIGIGRFVFRIRIYSFKVENLVGHYNQRHIEYPWVLHKLGSGQARTLLDVGCGGSLLAHELLARGFRVVGLDIRDHTIRNYREVFVKANAINTELPSESFDVIVLLSTIEHIGLPGYSQDLLKDDGDFLTMQELRRLLKRNGILVLTTPFEGKGPLRIHRFGKDFDLFERRYDTERLARLLEGFEVIDSAFFLCMLNCKCKFVPIEKHILDKLSSKITEGSLACLILRKLEKQAS